MDQLTSQSLQLGNGTHPQAPPIQAGQQSSPLSNIASAQKAPVLVSQAPAPSYTQDSGFFQGASNVDASHGTFSYVKGNQHIYNYAASLELEENAYLDRLSCAKGASYRSENHKQCLEGTRTSVLQDIEMWERGDSFFFVYWLKGVAGCGKSTIAQTFAQRSAARGQLGASFFCSRDFPDRRNLRLIFPTLARDLAYRYPKFRTALVKIIRSVPDIERDSLAVQIENLLVLPLKLTGLSTTIVVDALDECTDRESVSAFLSVLARHVGEIPNVKFLITGRPEDHIRSGFALPSLRTKDLALHDEESSGMDIRMFVKTGLGEVAMRNSPGMTSPWPSDDDITAITRKASGIFLIASIILGFVDNRDHRATPQDRLKLIISSRLDHAIFQKKSVIDQTYDEVLVASFNDIEKDDPEFFEQLRLVLASIVLPFHPLSRTGIAGILGISPERIRMILRSLHSVLIVPESPSQPIRICHTSLADFLTDPQRCSDKRFQIDAPAYHFRLSIIFLEMMNAKLTKNICQLPRYAMNKDVEDLPARRQKYIGASLAYACGYWANHLQSSIEASNDTRLVMRLVKDFFKNHFLSWLEVLSLEANLSAAVYSLHNVRSWLKDVKKSWLHSLLKASRLNRITSPISNLLDLIDDCERFVLWFFDLMEASALHIYQSALPWSPISSLTRRVYQRRSTAEAKVVNGVDTTWDACIRIIPVNDPVRKVVFSHKGTSIAILGLDRIKILDPLTGACLATLNTERSVLCIAFSFDDNLLVAGLLDGTVTVVDLQTGHLVQAFLGHTGMVLSVAFSPCGGMIASGADDETVQIWNMSLGRHECRLEGHSDAVRAVCWSAKGDQVISGSSDTTVRIWNIPERKCSSVIRRHTKMITYVAASQDLIASGSLDGTIKIYDLGSDHVRQTISTNDKIYSVRFSTHGDKMMYTGPNKASIWDLGRKKDVSTIVVDGSGADFSPDGTRIASDSGRFVKIWKTEGGHSNFKAVHHHSKEVVDVSFAPDGQLIASRSYSDAVTSPSVLDVKIWDTASGKRLFAFDSEYSISFSPNSAFLAYLPHAWSNHEWTIWNVRTRRLVKKMNCYTDRVALSADGNQMASVSDPEIKLWSLATSECLAKLELYDPSRRISEIAFDIDGSTIRVTTDDGHTKTWSISPAPLPDGHSPNYVKIYASFPMVLVPTQNEWSHQGKLAPSQCLYYKGDDEWIVDQTGMRILWVPPDRRSHSITIHDKKVAVGTKSGRVYVVDFSSTLSS